MSADLTFGQRRSIAFNRAFGRHRMLIALCCLLAFLTAALSFDPLRALTPVFEVLAYAAQAYLIYDVHRTTLLDAGAQRRPSLIHALKFTALSLGIFASTFAVIYALQSALTTEQPIMPGTPAFWLVFLASWGPFLVVYLVIFPIIALCFPSLAYDGRLRLAENIRAGLRIWPRTLWRIVVAVLPWIALGVIVMMSVQAMMLSHFTRNIETLATGEFTPLLIVLGLIGALGTLFVLATFIAVAVTLSETFRDEGSLHEQT